MSGLLEIDEVHKRFGEEEVLKGVSLAVDPHEVICLIGASGSGKSTLLRCINGLESIQNSNFGGFTVDFGPKDHVASSFVDLSMLTEDGKVRR